MKKRIVILTRLLIFSLSIVILSSTTCKKDETHYNITIKNNSNSAIYVTMTTAYPDTLILCPWGFFEISQNSNFNIESTYGWEEDFKGIETLQIFIIDANIAKTTPCDTIRKYNMILKRYALTYNDLQNNNWSITYP